MKFVFDGTKAEFVSNLETRLHIFNAEQNTDFIVDKKENTLSLGLGRIGYDSGLWYTPTIIETENSIIIDGKIMESPKWNLIDYCVFVLVLPIWLIFILIRLVSGHNYSSKKVAKSNLKCFMVEYLQCKEIK